MTPSRQTGVIKGAGSIAYAIELPQTENEETNAYLQELSEGFLTFLKKESEKPCNHLRFGGLRIDREEMQLTLFRAFCPFTERDYEKKAVLELDGEKGICRIKMKKRSGIRS